MIRIRLVAGLAGSMLLIASCASSEATPPNIAEAVTSTQSPTQSEEESLRDEARDLGPDPAVLEASSLTLCSYSENRYTVTRTYCDRSGHRIVSISVSLPIEVLDPDAESRGPVPGEIGRVLLDDGTTAYFQDESGELDNEATGVVGTGDFVRQTTLSWRIPNGGLLIKLISETPFLGHDPEVLGLGDLLAIANSISPGRTVTSGEATTAVDGVTFEDDLLDLDPLVEGFADTAWAVL